MRKANNSEIQVLLDYKPTVAPKVLFKRLMTKHFLGILLVFYYF